MEHIQRAHPLRVTLSQIVVDSHHVHAIACEGIEEHWQCSHEGLTFTSSHFGDFAFVKHDTANQLAVVVNHIPHHLVAAGSPRVVVDSLVAINFHEIAALCSQCAVKVGSGHHHSFALSKTACGVFHYGKHFWKRFCQAFFKHVEDFLFELIDAVPQWFAVLVVGSFNFCLKVGNFLFFVSHTVLQALAYGIDASTQLVVRQLLNLWIHSRDLSERRREFLQIASRFVAKQCL